MAPDLGAEPPIRSFFRGWWCFIIWEYTPPRGRGDRSGYHAFLKRMALSEAGVWIHKIISLVADISLSLALLIHYDDWFTEHGVRMGQHSTNLSGALCLASIFIVSHAAVSYFQALAWYLMRNDS